MSRNDGSLDPVQEAWKPAGFSVPPVRRRFYLEGRIPGCLPGGTEHPAGSQPSGTGSKAESAVSVEDRMGVMIRTALHPCVSTYLPILGSTGWTQTHTAGRLVSRKEVVLSASCQVSNRHVSTYF